jgi:hypothetical protein
MIDKGVAVGVPAWRLILTAVGVDGLLFAQGVPTFYQVGEWFLGCIIGTYLLFPLLHWIGRRSRWALGGVGVGVMIVGTVVTASHTVGFFVAMPICSVIFGMLAFRPKPNGYLALAGVVVWIGLWMTHPPLHPNTFNLLYGFSITLIIFWLGQFVRCVPVLWQATHFASEISFAVVLTHHYVFYRMLGWWYNPSGTGYRFVVIDYLLMLVIIFVASVWLVKAESWFLAQWRHFRSEPVILLRQKEAARTPPSATG